jgi:hypothetical protein
MSIAMKIPLLNSAIYSVIRKKLMDAFGGNVGIFIVGGGPMNQETESFLMKIKFPITIADLRSASSCAFNCAIWPCAKLMLWSMVPPWC